MIDLAGEWITQQEKPERPCPRCELHNVRIVNALPEDCPLLTSLDDAGVMKTLTERKTAAFKTNDADTMVNSVCARCAPQLMNKWAIRLLRLRAMTETTPQTTAKQASGIKGKVL